jgi:hypothetical protein
MCLNKHINSPAICSLYNMHKISAQYGRNSSKFSCSYPNSKLNKQTLIDFGICRYDGTHTLEFKTSTPDHNSIRLTIQNSYPFHFEFFSVVIFQQVYLMPESSHLSYTSLLRIYTQHYSDTSPLSYTPTTIIMLSC